MGCLRAVLGRCSLADVLAPSNPRVRFVLLSLGFSSAHMAPQSTAGAPDVVVGFSPGMNIDEISKLLLGVSWPINAGGRAAPATTGVSAAAPVFRMTFGLSKPYTSTPTVSPDGGEAGCGAVAFRLLSLRTPGETCTTVVAALSAESAMHVDGGNVGTTWTGCGGAHRGGRLWVSDGSAKGTAHSTRRVVRVSRSARLGLGVRRVRYHRVALLLVLLLLSR